MRKRPEGRPVSFDLYVWHEPAPITVPEARARLDAWLAGEQGSVASHVSVPLLRAELLARFPGAVTSPPSSPMLHVSAGQDLFDAVRHGAKRHGLVCYDPEDETVDPNAPGGFVVSSARLAPVANPDDRLLERTVRNLSADNFFVVLERSDGDFVQVGFGLRAGAAEGVYALEYAEGPDRHFRCDTTDAAEALRLVREFRAGLDGWRTRLPWRPFEL